MAHSASSFSSSSAATRVELSGHRARLASIRPRIDFSTPSSYFVLLSRAKKEQMQSEWAASVDAANLSLLSRMTALHHHPSSLPLDHHAERAEERERRKRQQSELDRLKEQRRIEDENRHLLERIRTQKSAYGPHNWQSHAQAYEKHLQQVRVRQLLIHDPLHAKEIIAQEKLKARQRQRSNKLTPLPSASSSSSPSTPSNPSSYERDPSIDAEEAVDAAATADAALREGAEVATFDADVDPADLLDQTVSSGTLSLTEYVPPPSTHQSVLVHQDGHTVDGRHVLLTVHDVNRATARPEVGLGEWTAFTAVPPVFLRCYLVRSYDLDSGLHCHLYVPWEPMKGLGGGGGGKEGGGKRVERMIAMMGYTDKGELYFKQRLMPKPVKGKGKGVGKLLTGKAAGEGGKKGGRKGTEEGGAKVGKKEQRAKPQPPADRPATVQPEPAEEKEEEEKTQEEEQTAVEGEEAEAEQSEPVQTAAVAAVDAVEEYEADQAEPATATAATAAADEEQPATGAQAGGEAEVAGATAADAVAVLEEAPAAVEVEREREEAPVAVAEKVEEESKRQEEGEGEQVEVVMPKLAVVQAAEGGGQLSARGAAAGSQRNSARSQKTSARGTAV